MRADCTERPGRTTARRSRRFRQQNDPSGNLTTSATGNQCNVATLPQLKNVDTYRPCDWDLKDDPTGRRYWVGLFCNHIDTLVDAISATYPTTTPSELASFRLKYLAAMRSIDDEPERFERIDILTLDQLRNDVQKEFGFHDPYQGIKQHENELALELLPGLLNELDATPGDALIEKLALGLMAGNLFDLGAKAAVEHYQQQCADFRRLRTSLPKRPWLVDGVNAWRDRWHDGRAYEHVAFFVDNAGSDICLGCIPLIRWMLREGSRVTLAANSGPALNDVTAPELSALLDHIANVDNQITGSVAEKRLLVTASGGWAPLLDLRELSGECVSAIRDADLIILLGMGRAIESNYHAAFSCDSLRLAVLKDEAVARRTGGRLFDCVFRFEPARFTGSVGPPRPT